MLVSEQHPQSDDPLAPLTLFDALQVGPVRLEPHRLVAPYQLKQGNQREERALIYRFQEPVFAPHEPESINLACMLAAQVALNYGLFCREMVFCGPFDTLDRRFIRTMAENTAREIYVKKFLSPNPFLKEAARGLPENRQKRYLRAKIRFKGPDLDAQAERWNLWKTHRNRYCVLSSGGKESLLSFGLLRELSDADGHGQVHPVFVNESGRHWFTALNAHRHFKAHMAGTSRVWVNSDRIFSWMLRRMPIVRPDFANLRSDDYPIRLWTVAIFIFAALPLMRSRRLGRLIMGNEHDTTCRVRTHGITHYDGLFDQSVFFDQAMSRYFMQKGWAISQFSLLRPLSELLVETVLSQRYPHLQELQVSCHAAHKQEGRIHPCGRCEKCRRVVGMLSAIGADATRCGYSPQQIDHCLKELAVKALHQEDAGAEHLIHLLDQRRLVPTDVPNRRPAKVHAEIQQLRFDRERSPTNAIPVDLRRRLWPIFLEYAQGAVQRRGRRWTALPIPEERLLADAYPFEMDTAVPPAASGVVSQPPVADYQWALMSWPQIEKRLQVVDIALLPVGSIEQHGPHLPLDTDAFDADHLANRVAEACSAPRPLVLPPIAYGVSYHHDDFKGTLSVSNQTLSGLVYDVGMSCAANGIKKLVIINGHGGNAPALNYAAQMINRDAGIFVCVDTGETSDVDIAQMIRTPNDVHAGEIETSTSLAVRPHLVHMAAAKAAVPEFSSRYLNFSSKRGISWYGYTRQISASGVMGDPTAADAQKGRRIWAVMIAHLVAFVEDLKHLSLEEIHQRRL